ncbi:hypothetical protein C4901_15795 [Acidiferrobacter sp. SPIII_3]|nr:hypothetical protein C4901_15795 [Acidiferrobacter sp. SPIII_3]
MSNPNDCPFRANGWLYGWRQDGEGRGGQLLFLGSRVGPAPLYHKSDLTRAADRPALVEPQP